LSWAGKAPYSKLGQLRFHCATVLTCTLEITVRTGKTEKQYHRQGKKKFLQYLLIKTNKNTKYKEATMAVLDVNCKQKNRFFT
jgi:hypothetical protein